MVNYLISLIKELYLISVGLSSKLKRKNHDKVVFLLSFPETSIYVIDELYKKYEGRLIVCYTNNAKSSMEKYINLNIDLYNIDSFTTLLLKVSPIVRTATIVLCDNYFAFLGGINFSATTNIVQLWHANGAIKKFGIEALYALKMNKKDILRYQKVYSKFTHFIVSSNKMGNIFHKSFKSDGKLLCFGYPLTDYYFSDNQERKIVTLKKKLNKKVLLYIPTYRDQNLKSIKDIAKIKKMFEKEWIILVHPHPRDKFLIKQLSDYDLLNQEFIGSSLQDLLIVADCIITDYSSVVFEYTIANPKGQIVFYCYDMEEYSKTTGIQSDFGDWAKPMIAKDLEELIHVIQSNNISESHLINKLWNEYTTGKAICQLTEWIDQIYDN